MNRVENVKVNVKVVDFLVVCFFFFCNLVVCCDVGEGNRIVWVLVIDIGY